MIDKYSKSSTIVLSNKLRCLNSIFATD